MEVQQKYLKKTGLIALIAVMNMVVPLSLDMYLPAVPQMTQVFNTSESVVNITLVGFFFFMAAGDNSTALPCGCSLIAGNFTFGGKGNNFGAEKPGRSD